MMLCSSSTWREYVFNACTCAPDDLKRIVADSSSSGQWPVPVFTCEQQTANR